MPILYKGAPMMARQPVKCLQMSPKCLQNVSKCLQNVSKMSSNVGYRLHQSQIPNVLSGCTLYNMLWSCQSLDSSLVMLLITHLIIMGDE